MGSDIDNKAVDTARVLAADAVEKVGNGHPGTAMSLAPAAYLLFQKVHAPRPARPALVGRDRFILSAGHSLADAVHPALPGGYGLELDDLKALRTWGSLTPGHPEYGHTDGVEITTGPLGQGSVLRGRVRHGRPPRARPVRPGRRPRARARSTTSST